MSNRFRFEAETRLIRWGESSSLIEKFEARYIPEPNSGCWLWIGANRGNGYGGLNRKLAHRISWEIFCGPIPNGLSVLHTCDVRVCVNPAHLYLGTDLENAADREARERGNHATGDSHRSRTRPETLRRGADNHATKLTESQVLTIRSSSDSARSLSQTYGVTPQLIRQILQRKIWKHL